MMLQVLGRSGVCDFAIDVWPLFLNELEVHVFMTGMLSKVPCFRDTAGSSIRCLLENVQDLPRTFASVTECHSFAAALAPDRMLDGSSRIVQEIAGGSQPGDSRPNRGGQEIRSSRAIPQVWRPHLSQKADLGSLEPLNRRRSDSS
jgi:hypothetical protein